jgi:hypothetical protein
MAATGAGLVGVVAAAAGDEDRQLAARVVRRCVAAAGAGVAVMEKALRACRGTAKSATEVEAVRALASMMLGWAVEEGRAGPGEAASLPASPVEAAQAVFAPLARHPGSPPSDPAVRFLAECAGREAVESLASRMLMLPGADLVLRRADRLGSLLPKVGGAQLEAMLTAAALRAAASDDRGSLASCVLFARACLKAWSSWVLSVSHVLLTGTESVRGRGVLYGTLCEMVPLETAADLRSLLTALRDDRSLAGPLFDDLHALIRLRLAAEDARAAEEAAGRSAERQAAECEREARVILEAIDKGREARVPEFVHRHRMNRPGWFSGTIVPGVLALRDPALEQPRLIFLKDLISRNICAGTLLRKIEAAVATAGAVFGAGGGGGGGEWGFGAPAPRSTGRFVALFEPEDGRPADDELKDAIEALAECFTAERGGAGALAAAETLAAALVKWSAVPGNTSRKTAAAVATSVMRCVARGQRLAGDDAWLALLAPVVEGDAGMARHYGEVVASHADPSAAVYAPTWLGVAMVALPFLAATDPWAAARAPSKPQERLKLARFARAYLEAVQARTASEPPASSGPLVPPPGLANLVRWLVEGQRHRPRVPAERDVLLETSALEDLVVSCPAARGALSASGSGLTLAAWVRLEERAAGRPDLEEPAEYYRGWLETRFFALEPLFQQLCCLVSERGSREMCLALVDAISRLCSAEDIPRLLSPPPLHPQTLHALMLLPSALFAASAATALTLSRAVEEVTAGVPSACPLAVARLALRVTAAASAAPDTLTPFLFRCMVHHWDELCVSATFPETSALVAVERAALSIRRGAVFADPPPATQQEAENEAACVLDAIAASEHGLLFTNLPTVSALTGAAITVLSAPGLPAPARRAIASSIPIVTDLHAREAVTRLAQPQAQAQAILLLLSSLPLESRKRLAAAGAASEIVPGLVQAYLARGRETQSSSPRLKEMGAQLRGVLTTIGCDKSEATQLATQSNLADMRSWGDAQTAACLAACSKQS